MNGVETAVDSEPDVINETGKHPLWGGDPTALQLAAERGNAAIARLLISQGADLENQPGLRLYRLAVGRALGP